MTHEDAIRKALACLKLAQSPNQHEAALAAAKAQEIVDRYNLTLDHIPDTSPEPDGPISNFAGDPIAEACMHDKQWTIRLASVVARINGCRIYICNKGGGGVACGLVGRPKDAQTARYIFSWLNQEVRRITRTECAGFSQKYKKDFRFGVIETIATKLQSQQQETISAVKAEAAHNPLALQVIQKNLATIQANTLAVKQWMNDNMNLRKARTTTVNVGSTARQHGRVAGNDVRFTRATGALAAGNKQIR